ncbi:hypothetical protein CYR81_09515 [Enterococcus faecalis]|uniref:hypothetical protein n=1 Tax=Enterococcus faecalis TaxID=1351 RepID=UPI000C75FA8C|nr:hypothetical protein [Enterococcus faecalis]PLA80388.1 hypothetical protein CYR81_09515 [Enterococcus faecalis]
MIKINRSNSKSGSNYDANSIEEAQKIVSELIDKDTVTITIKQKECEEGEPVTANGDKFSDVNNG